MSTAAQPVAALPRRHSTRDRQSTPSRANPDPSSPRRSASSAQPPPPSSHSHSHSHSRPPSANLQNVARQDFEQTNLARPQSNRQSNPQDRPMTGGNGDPQRTESNRHPTHARTSSRYDGPTSAPNGSSTNDTRPGPPNLRRRTAIDAQTGHWDLGKTIGAGSMGKVKLARNKDTGEQVAVKIVPRQSTDGEHRTQAERDRADHSKEVRTAREAAIVTLVDHPYICGMRDVVRTNYHWYMLFEYVNGGQMLDYIISHGRLKEKQARKFSRQIASALDYCHRNSIVHRDLKIENILISKNGDIKIIDFGLSNLFSPKNFLKTFCGSLYFAAPELLQAKQYTGPEVDVWSFGIVLYVLVCGKVPFDDQSMPQLHAKIKRGNVDYPPWLTPECRNLISRMLNTNPAERATLGEIMNHQWMTKGSNGPPENYLPLRKPLQLPLDPAVIEKMTGFDFGAADVITGQLTKIVESEDYQRAVRMSERRQTQQLPELERKRGVFDFYKRRSSTTSRDTLTAPSSEAVGLGQDPANAFHPLISVYYLAMEKQEREAKEANPGALALPQSPGETPLQVPDLPEPPAAYTNSQSYEMAGEQPTGGRSRPRARTHGEDEVQQGLQNLNVSTAPSPTNPVIVEPPIDQQPQVSRRENTAASLLRRLSTRRHRDPPERPERGEKPNHPPSSLAGYASSTESPRKSFSMRRTREREREREISQIRLQTEPPLQPQGALLSPPLTGGDATGEKPNKRSFGLGRSISVNSSDMRRRLSRRGVSEGSSMRPPSTSRSSHDNRPSTEKPHATRDVASDVEGSSYRPHTSGLTNRTKSLGHARKESMQTRRAHRDVGDVPEETDQEIQDEMELSPGGNSHNPGFKPVYLKGMFSVQTTSSKSPQFIHADIIRVLKQLGVQYVEVRGGFKCRHAPSIKAQADDSGSQPLSPPADGAPNKRKISFGGFRDRNTVERDAFRAQHPPTARQRQQGYDTADDSDEDPSPPQVSAPFPPRAAGETSTHVQSDFGGNMVLKFEVFVVKVPIFSLHGIQFKKVDGGTWQYKNIAQTILKELRL